MRRYLPAVAASVSFDSRSRTSPLTGGCSRIGICQSFSDNANRRYSIINIPRDVGWGTGTNDRLACVNDEPITIWLTGEVRTTWFTTPSGEPHKNVSVGLRMLRTADTAAALDALGSRSTIAASTCTP